MDIAKILEEYVPTAAGELALGLESLREVVSHLARATGQDMDPVVNSGLCRVRAHIESAVVLLTEKLPKR
jgi:hypothetical protein